MLESAAPQAGDDSRVTRLTKVDLTIGRRLVIFLVGYLVGVRFGSLQHFLRGSVLLDLTAALCPRGPEVLHRIPQGGTHQRLGETHTGIIEAYLNPLGN